MKTMCVQIDGSVSQFTLFQVRESIVCAGEVQDMERLGSSLGDACLHPSMRCSYFTWRHPPIFPLTLSKRDSVDAIHQLRSLFETRDSRRAQQHREQKLLEAREQERRLEEEQNPYLRARRDRILSNQALMRNLGIL